MEAQWERVGHERSRSLREGLRALTALTAEAWAALAVLASPRRRRFPNSPGDELGQEMAALAWLLVAAGFTGQLRGRQGAELPGRQGG